MSDLLSILFEGTKAYTEYKNKERERIQRDVGIKQPKPQIEAKNKAKRYRIDRKRGRLDELNRNSSLLDRLCSPSFYMKIGLGVLSVIIFKGLYNVKRK